MFSVWQLAAFFSNATFIEYDQRDAANALKRFLIGQFVKFFLLLDSFKAFVARPQIIVSCRISLSIVRLAVRTEYRSLPLLSPFALFTSSVFPITRMCALRYECVAPHVEREYHLIKRVCASLCSYSSTVYSSMRADTFDCQLLHPCLPSALAPSLSNSLSLAGMESHTRMSPGVWLAALHTCRSARTYWKCGRDEECEGRK